MTRIGDHGRAVPPKIRPSSIRAFELDEVAFGGATDRARNATAAVFTGTPPLVDSPTGKARRFLDGGTNGLEEGAATAESRSAAEGDWTVTVFARLTATPGGTRTLFSLAGQIGDAPADPANYMLAIGVTSTRAPQMFWEFGAGTNVQTIATTYRLPLYEWVAITWRKYNTTGPGDTGGTCDLDLIINGHVVETFLARTNTSHGSAAVWRIGHERSAGAAINNPPADIDAAHFWAEALTDAEIWEDVRRLQLLEFFTRVDLRVDFEDQAGLMVDLSDFHGVDWVDGVEHSDEVDQPVSTADVKLLREVDKLSLAALVTTSKANLTDVFDPTSYAPLVEGGRRVHVMAARVPLGVVATDRDFREGSVFDGHLDDPSEADDEGITLHCRDEGGVLIDTLIEQDVEYGDVPPGVAVEGEMQFVLNDNDNVTGFPVNDSVPGLRTRTGSYPPITLNTPVSPGWAVGKWLQRKEGVLPALRALAGQIAWECRYRFDENPAQKTWRLTFYDPDRNRLDVHSVVLERDIVGIQQFGRNILDVRTGVLVAYPSAELALPALPALPAGYTGERVWNNVDGEGGRVQSYVYIESTTSITNYKRRRTMLMVEAGTSQIDSIGEATDMALGALQDTDEANLAYGFTLECRWEMRINSLLKIAPVRKLHTGAQRLAVKRVTHSFSETPTTTIELRGKPSAGHKRWLRLEAGRSSNDDATISPLNALGTQTQTTLLQTMRSLLDRTRFGAGGKFLAIRNGSFDAYSAGRQNPPDAWTPAAGGTWGPTATSGDYYFDSDSMTGGLSLRLRENGLSPGRSLDSELIPINGSPHIPYSVQVTWKRKTPSVGTSSDGVQVVVEVYDVNRVFVGILGVPIFSDNGSTLVETWITERVEGLKNVFTTAAFMRCRVRKSTAGANRTDVLVDSVQPYRTANRLRLRRQADQLRIAAVAGSQDWNNVAWTAPASPPVLPDINHGGDIISGNFLNSALPGLGNGFVVYEPGTYEVKVHVAADTVAAGRRFSVRVWRTATGTIPPTASNVYDANRNLLNAAGGGVILQGDSMEMVAKGDQGYPGAGVQSQLGFAAVLGEVFCNRGDVLTVQWFANQQIDVVGTTDIPEGSFWDVRLKSTD